MEERKILLSARDLNVKFRVRGRVLTAIRDISLDIYEGESIAIVGESGCGKSVLTKAFAGMLDNNGFIDHGDILFHDPELADVTVPLSGAANSLITWKRRKRRGFHSAKPNPPRLTQSGRHWYPAARRPLT